MSGKTLELCNVVLANIMIMEVTEYTPWRLEERLKIRNELRKRKPDCKIVLDMGLIKAGMGALGGDTCRCTGDAMKPAAISSTIMTSINRRKVYEQKT